MSIKILVPVKRVVDPNVRVRVSASGTIETAGLKMSLNPFDECAVERALQLKEAGHASHVTVITCGQTTSQDVLRTALAMGADSAVLLDTGAATSTLDSLAVARLLQSYLSTQDCYGLVLCGKQAIDGDTGGVPAMLAGLLDLPQALDACAIEADGTGWRVTSGDDTGTVTWRLEGAAVVSADLRLAEPRRVTLPSIVKAKQKPLATIDAATFNIDLAPRAQIVELNDPPAREAGIKVKDTATLIEALASHRVFEQAGAVV
ncbi:electron transfer flavoprotein beta subunit [Paraburkholderia youngii]|uniref:Electron transfer flavoprotein subunit beta n=1 Tax=Paraburkholderia youngii TaxID=2782701 RepID=A0A7W8L324_9BURK|nr:electron transfer flavoprotein beta subunit [Paraburkholderia youngii]NUX56624.1 electron transfer flavoprotein subunit beta/FixA family protein [Paraburkholderia youngii]NVI05250.1 electron transfer flavoprotein subunit beta/FixA family protein [Paraburkholderia youngii]